MEREKEARKRVEAMAVRNRVEPYPETHQQGLITIETPMNNAFNQVGDFGILIASDGRIWICINGEAIIRFKPNNDWGKRKEDGANTASG